MSEDGAVTSISEAPSDAWRRLLRGGFAFQTAPFAAHPNDADRARQMYFMALRAGASQQQVLDEAKSYLEGKIPSNPSEVARMVQAVARFMKRMERATRRKRAWVIFWHGTEVRPGQEVVAIMDPRKSPEKILEFVEQMYASSACSLREKLRLATNRKDNPYPARYSLKDHRLIAITCGHNPWLEARLVKNVRIDEDLEGRQSLDWDI